MVLVLWGFKDKIMLHCFREVKCQEFDIAFDTYNSGLMVLTVSYQAVVHSCLEGQFLYYQIPNTDSIIKFYFQKTFVMKMNCGILESCVAIVTKHKSSKGTPKLTFADEP